MQMPRGLWPPSKCMGLQGPPGSAKTGGLSLGSKTMRLSRQMPELEESRVSTCVPKLWSHYPSHGLARLRPILALVRPHKVSFWSCIKRELS